MSTAWNPATGGTIDALFDDATKRFADRDFLEFEGARLTYGDVRDQVLRCAGGLQALGVGRGDRVASLLDNSTDAVVCLLASTVLGAVYVPINTAYRGAFLVHQLNDCGAAVVIVEADLLGRVTDEEDELTNIEMIVVRGTLGGTAPRPTGVMAFDALLRSDPIDPPRTSARGDLACLIYTAGTTGLSKGCMLTHNQLTNAAVLLATGRGEDEPHWTPLPLFHLNAMVTVLSTLGLGALVSIARRFSVSTFWDDIERSGARLANLLGPMTMFLAEAPESEAEVRCRGQLRRVLSAPFPEEAQAVFRERFGVQEVVGAAGYGSTEAAPLSMAVPGAPPTSSGMVTPFYDVAIVDDHDDPVPAGEVGEIICRPKFPHIMFEGYWNNPEATLRAMRNMWFHTGDLGRLDEGGFLYFVDRKQDYLRRRGENISSIELEMAIVRHEAVAEVAAYGAPAPEGEDEVHVSVVLVPGAAVTEPELCRWIAEQVPYFAVPRYIHLTDELPHNAVGRVLKRQLRDEAATSPGWDRENDDSVVVQRR